ncbi:AtzE family amidohydrolase [Thalassobaculum sp. OXR-137]|uniref:AtzE family amidohydrolase n=1 Tax=Thalassobaculum sp. OXR-137 TaxID=3100173 RepID=UPI002AC93D2D|nr:AtzE family amidohydrolase [Thalassobaculum sp. OXR-137]WPZ34568.1 AtzE family amidohydrolase [Thalassobaculum sp. OXR-137]
MSGLDAFSPAWRVAEAVAAGSVGAETVVREALDRIAAVNPAVNAFTAVTAERALDRARAVDADRAAGRPLPPLAGVPFAVKNLFDIQGLSTLAGSKINRDLPPATRDGVLIERLTAAGAVLIGALNMGEYAYDFTGENAHDGACRNPHDTSRMAGGSSSGSGAAMAAGLAALTLGSDTNGSIRVPASFCGVFGLKPTYGRLSRAGSFPFCDSLDHLGPFARCVRDLALAYDAMQGPASGDPACAGRPAEPVSGSLDDGIDGLRIATLGGYFDTEGMPEAAAAVEAVAATLGGAHRVEVDGVAAGRAAAFVITNVESAALHLANLRTRLDDFDPDTRDRFVAGATLPGAWYARAQQVRRWYAERFVEMFRHIDVLIAPATPFPAPAVGQRTVAIRGREVLLRPNIGIFTQPVSAVGLPVCAVPVATSGLPIGVQVIAAPWREDLCLRVARVLETAGTARFAAPSGL